ncbi:hypothetical protein EDB87DRAFT_1581422 [Lactarius vividus]|nr:hypothetical protein EDB87DRAFT_1581422 [Lactarius vividus]
MPKPEVLRQYIRLEEFDSVLSAAVLVKKSRRGYKSQGADLEAQPEDEEIRRMRVHEMSTFASEREDEASRITGGALVREAVREAQSGSSIAPQAIGTQKDGRVRYLLDTCKNHSLFTKKEVWRMRARGCVETVASFVFCANVKLGLFGDLGRLLRELGEFERIRELSAAGSDGAFVTRWTCLSLVDVTRRILNHDTIKANARLAINCLSRFRIEDDSEQTNNGDDDENALKNARRIDNCFETASQIYVDGLRRALRPWEVGRTEDQLRDVLARTYVVNISTLERIAPAADHISTVGFTMSALA